jgi:hypothetical protein
LKLTFLFRAFFFIFIAATPIHAPSLDGSERESALFERATRRDGASVGGISAEIGSDDLSSPRGSHRAYIQEARYDDEYYDNSYELYYYEKQFIEDPKIEYEEESDGDGDDEDDEYDDEYGYGDEYGDEYEYGFRE